VNDTWYHGSPLALTELRPGSTITQDRDLARVFSHRPPVVSLGDDGEIKHSGTLPGYLYRIAEEIRPEDVYPHPRSTISPGTEWLIRRALRVELIGSTQVVEEERLTEADIARMRRHLDRQTTSLPPSS
jgi:hypothetical protein